MLLVPIGIYHVVMIAVHQRGWGKTVRPRDALIYLKRNKASALLGIFIAFPIVAIFAGYGRFVAMERAKYIRSVLSQLVAKCRPQEWLDVHAEWAFIARLLHEICILATHAPVLMRLRPPPQTCACRMADRARLYAFAFHTTQA